MTRRERGHQQQHLARQRVAADPRPASSAAVPETPEPTSPAAIPENPGGPTGPRTAQGKAVSSRNASKHNLCAHRLTGTDLAEYSEIRAALAAEWSPSSQTEHFLLDQMALSQWRIARALDIELAAFSPEGPGCELDSALLALALRYRTAAERAYYKALTEFQRLRAHSLAEQKLEAEAAEAETRRDLERLCFAPIAPAEFVSQTPLPPSATTCEFVSQTTALPSATAAGFVSQHHAPASACPSTRRSGLQAA